MNERLLIDTDILVDYLRGFDGATEFLDNQEGDLLISSITVAELFAGVREVEERRKLDQFLLAFEVVPVGKEIAKKAGLFRRDYGPSHGLGLADALIVATADQKRARLTTLNSKHFPMTEVYIPYEKP